MCLPEPSEPAWIDHQLRLFRDALSDAVVEVCRGATVVRALQLDGGVKRAEQRQASHVADEDVAAVRHAIEGGFEHAIEVPL